MVVRQPLGQERRLGAILSVVALQDFLLRRVEAAEQGKEKHERKMKDAKKGNVRRGVANAEDA